MSDIQFLVKQLGEAGIPADLRNALTAELNKLRLLESDGNKTKAVTDGLYGPTHIFDVCMREEFGYGLWTNTNSQFLAWLQPELIFDQNQLKILIMDWRNQFTAGLGSSETWCYTPPYTPNALKGCIMDYCFNPERYYWASRRNLTPQDFQKVCFSLPAMNLNGQRITNQEDYEQFRMFEAMRQKMCLSLIQDDAYTTGGTNLAPEDGIEGFFDNFSDRHPELTGACTQLGPVTIDLDGPPAIALADVPAQIYQRIWQLRYLTKYLVGSPVLTSDSFVLLMNDFDAECLARAQTCIKFCIPITFTSDILTPEGRQRWYNDFNSRRMGGRYGGGYFELEDGTIIDIMRDPNIPRGTFYLLTRGWAGNPYGLRLGVQNWSEWARYNSGKPGVTIQTIGNGAMLYLEEPGICTSAHLRWNWRLFSNAPWLQTRFINLDACSEVVDPTFDPFETLSHATVCDQVQERQIG